MSDKTYIHDGNMYDKKEDVPDLGSFENTGVFSGNVRFYQGNSTDINKLPDYVGAGSRAYCLDTGEIYVFYRKDRKWRKVINSGGNNSGSGSDEDFQNAALEWFEKNGIPEVTDDFIDSLF